ncbi:hypothetical protein [Alteribacter natronophilus]|uniref:hypothetical protein n=1 Tax=Alteribacter natronophilus TaxID=2583810 RepID=UPI00110E2A39|nr:hypothetical protein [Alteribacter natronophilus]TMW72040.1 hypothetical protein FGB90_07410 [Alteribacter natronophilus]
MGSIIYHTECKQCEKIAVKDDYYKEDKETYNIYCPYCGYTYFQGLVFNEEIEINEWKVKEEMGCGVFQICKTDGTSTLTLLKTPITDKSLISCEADFHAPETNQSESYLIEYKEGKFTQFLGTAKPPYFEYSYQQYKKEKNLTAEDFWF